MGDTGGEEAHTQAPAESGVNGQATVLPDFNAFVEYTGAPTKVDGYIGQAQEFWGVNVNQSSAPKLSARNADDAASQMPPYGVANVFIKT